MQSRKQQLAYTIAALFTGAIVAEVALAQQATPPPQKVEKIEVTGSNIKRIDAEGPAPVQIITRQDIERSGQTTVGEVLRNLPINSAASFDDSFTGSFARGSSGVSLRGLGQKSTLTLINGRRMANNPFAQNLQDAFVDLNSIPLAAIDRIEVLKDGASAIYGSDAIAGVVNIILRKDFSGLELSTGYGRSSHSDGAEKRASIAGGWGEAGKDKYNILGVLDYFERDTIWARDRDFSRTTDQRQFQGGTDLRSTLSNPGNYARVAGFPPPFGPTRIPFPNCPAARLVPINGLTQCVEDTNVYNTLIPETKRLGLFSRLTYDFSSSLTGFVEVGFNKTETFTQAVPFAAPANQIGPGVARQINARLPVGNPNNPYNVPVDVRYRFDDVGPRQIFNDTEAKRFVAGLKGTAGTWDWETGVLYGNSHSTQDDKNGISVSGLLAVIADGSYNFLNPSANTAATYQRLKAEYQRRGDSTIKQWDAKGTSELMQLPAGPLAVALGLETRKESLDDTADDILIKGDVLGRGSSRAKGSRTLTSGYAEFSVPIIKNLELQIAGRTDHYSDFGSSTTPKVAFRWTPVRELLIRGSYAKGFRAPNLVEAGDSAAFAFNTVVDTRRCAINIAYCPTVGAPAIISAGQGLKPEKSDSRSLGFVWDITKDASLAVDGFDISQKRLISTEGAQTILDLESTDPIYAARVLRAPPDATDIARGAPGNIVGVLNQFVNLTELRTKGYDLDLRWRFAKNETGTWSFNSINTYVHSYKTQNVKTDPLIEFAGTYSLPRSRGVHTLSWERGPWFASATFSHIDKYGASTSAPVGATDVVGNFDTTDLQAAFSGFKNLKLTLGIRNIMDREPPIDLSSGAIPYDFTQHNARGRFYYGTINYKFK
jgi:iron complex outermembrane recepter protein